MSSYFSGLWSAIRGKRSAIPTATREKLRSEEKRIRAKYDAAQTTDENTKHWLQADDLSAKAANSAAVRATLRSRARYERDNNSYLKGMVKTFANEIIATGPRLQLKTSNQELNRGVEQTFGEWMKAAQIPAKLALFVETRLIDGELFGIFTTNPLLTTPVKLDVKIIEAEQVSTPWPDYSDKLAVDGIHFDANGNVKFYDLLKTHPGGSGEFSQFFSSWETRAVRPENMLHYFRTERAGQARGIPDVTAALSLFAQLRRYTLAVLMAAELAASFAAIIETDLPPGSVSDACAWECIDVIRGTMQTLPNGAKMNQFRPEQPTTTYSEFVRCLLREISRCFEMPLSIATGDNSDNSYAGGRLEVQSWERKVLNERCRGVEPMLLDRIFKTWVAEAALIPGYLPPFADMQPPEFWRFAWQWDGFAHVDPMKEARADDMGLRNGSRSLTDLCNARGKDILQHFAELKSEAELFQEAGLPSPLATPAAPSPTDQQQQSQDQQDQQAAQEQGVEYATTA